MDLAHFPLSFFPKSNNVLLAFLGGTICSGAFSNFECLALGTCDLNMASQSLARLPDIRLGVGSS